MIDPADLIASGHQLEIRAADPACDRIDDVLPGLIVTPKTAEAVAATLRWAATNTRSVVIRGGGSKVEWGARAPSIDLVLDMSRLNQVLVHQPGDLTVTVEAGIRLRDLNEQLAPHGQWLALDPVFADRATVGGLLATNDSGPQRHRFGTPRDLVIGIQLATTDGTLSKAGGQVVKNVAGYDLSKLVSGSFGTLAAIVSATFKLTPLPEASSTIEIDRLSLDELVAVAGVITSSQLEPVAFEVRVHQSAGSPAPEIACLIRFASFAGVVEAEVANASSRIATVHQVFRVVSGSAEHELWAAHGRRPWDAPGTIVRAAWRPAALRAVLEQLIAFCRSTGFELVGRVGVGAGYIRLPGDLTEQAAAVQRLRSSGAVGNVLITRAPMEMKTADSVWPRPRSTAALEAALKRELDPVGVLGAGRGPR
jgi:glycolate oxidase FAD binding subunit